MKYNFDEPVNRIGTYSMKWNDDAFFHRMIPNYRLDKDTIRLQLADMDFRCAPAIKDAMHRVADHENFGYTTLTSAPEYKQAIIGWYKKRHQLDIKEEWLVHSNGALEGVEQTIYAFSEPGDGVIICRPIYHNFTETIKKMGRCPVNCQMVNFGAGRYEFDWEAIEEACAKEENKVFILCSPQNPLGRIWKKEELQKLAEICRRNQVMIVSDEIHSDIVRGWEKHLPIIGAVEDLSNIIMVSGVNKTFNLMGLHCAFCVIPDDELREKFSKGYEPSFPTPFAIAGTIAAYNESEDWVDALNAYLDDTLKFAVEYFAEKMPKLKAYVPEGSYVLWLDFSDYGYSGKTLMYLVNNVANVAVQNGDAIDPDHGEMFIRMCLTSSKANVKLAIERIAKAFDEYENNQ